MNNLVLEVGKMNRKKTILILEQEYNVANGLKSILVKEGYNAVLRYNYYHIKEFFQKQKPDLVIINISVSKEFGLNILRKTKKSFPALPIIAMSVYSNSLSRNELARFGADDFIAKPFDVEYLKSRIEELVGSA